ncbi:MAG: PKD domain-containing protein [Bacteroidota bacterium]
MKNIFFFILVAGISFTFSASATHIVGGEIYYKYLGNDNYEITMKLYRDCFYGVPELPDPALIQVFDSDGNPIAGSPFDFNRLTYDSLDLSYSNICFIPPGDICVQEAIYRDTLNLPPIVGGYQVSWDECCRNLSITNIVNPGSAGSALYIIIYPDTLLIQPSATIIWLEDFTLANGTAVDAGLTAWSRTTSGSEDWAEVRNNLFEVKEADGQVVWTSEYIDISAYPGGVDLSADLSESGGQGADDYIEIYYKLDAGGEVLFPNNGSFWDDFGSATANATQLLGDSISIIVKIDNDDDTHYHRFDNVTVSEYDPPIWLEDFTLADGTTVDAGPTGWSRTLAVPGPTDWSEVRSNRYETRDIDVGEVVWTSEYINISAFPAGVSLSIDLDNDGNLEANADTIKVLYKLDAGGEVLFSENGMFAGNFAAATAYARGLAGDSVSVVVRMKNSADNEIYWLDNLAVFNFVPPDTVALGPNNSPLFDNLPPVFICFGDSLLFDQSATDPDGDSLVYSLSTPYDDEPGSPPFDLISWLAPYTEANQIDGTLTIGPQTGELFVLPSAIGQYLVGISVKEYRDDVLLSENKRDFQFNVVACDVDPITASPSDNYSSCGSTTISFVNDSAGAESYFWDFGIPGIDTDTTSDGAPSYTYPDTGSYTVTVITNPGTLCADTGYGSINIASVIAGFSATDSVCMNTDITFSDTSIVSNDSITSWDWDFDNGDTSTDQDPTYAFPDSGTFNVILIIASDSGCTDTAQNTIFIQKQPVADAGLDQPVCANNSVVTLAGSATIASGGGWITGGSGAFADSSDLNTTYTPSPADTVAGSVTLLLITTGNGLCPADSNDMTVTITPAPTVDAGTDQTVCADTAGVQLDGSATVATGGGWISSGSGSFTPDTATLSATYVPSDADTAAGFVTLTLISTGNGTCLPDSDVMNIIITPAPTVDPGPNDTVCANDPDVTLSGSITTATGGVWSGGAGTYNPDDITLGATYTPSVGEIAAGTVTLTLTTTGNGDCNSVSDSMTITITSAPTANAGTDTSVCVNNPVVTLSGVVTIATGGSWSKSGDGSFGNPLLLNTTYTPGAADITAGTVTLTLTTTGNGNCLAVTDDIIITITSAPTADAGSNTTVCANNADVTLSGSVTVATGGVWATGGDGTFTDSSDLGTTYTPGPADKTAGTVTLTLIEIE